MQHEAHVTATHSLSPTSLLYVTASSLACLDSDFSDVLQPTPTCSLFPLHLQLPFGKADTHQMTNPRTHPVTRMASWTNLLHYEDYINIGVMYWDLIREAVHSHFISPCSGFNLISEPSPAPQLDWLTNND